MSLYVPSIARRQLLRGAASLAGLALAPAAIGGVVLASPSLADNPFSLGVASGEPEADGVVLWTRLAPKPFEPDGGMPPEPVAVAWEVAEDQSMRKVVRSGKALARPNAGHSVHVEVGGLKPGREYWYRFTAVGAQSPVGRTRTAPARGAAVDRLRLCFASCQKYEAGFYSAYAHMVEEAPDLILFLGDYIYEGNPGSKGAVRLHANPEPKDVAGYRVRYATYKSDPLLQAAHAVAPWMVTWDDHEVANDYGADRDQDSFDPAGFLRRRAAAYQVYYEHMPLRRRAAPVGPDMLLYRALDWGSLAQIQMVDDRQYRDGKPCQPAGPSKRGKLIGDCEERRDPTRSILGKPQEAWLLDVLASSKAQWNLLAQQTLMAELQLGDPAQQTTRFYSSDGWDGYPANRARIVERWREAKVSNPIALGGDIHAFAAANLTETLDGPPVASTFVGGSISSLGGESDVFAAKNPHIKQFDGKVRGYGRLDLTPKDSRMTFRTVENALVATSPIRDLASFALENGRPGVHRA
ncbi:alkaline phosphatase [Phenylobacterium sp.]|uniref:alkaline phosphatase D family protein n=1 Tax=Phenylobacterium sp. TaxID=1871053 RepID=UPI002737D57C|nr:alkaline phosphatase D family protein [Phenylobacterium sp.]MDP3867691.1 alkaline phosphatase D family protein [Phenylobacterium sp.]